MPCAVWRLRPKSASRRASTSWRRWATRARCRRSTRSTDDRLRADGDGQVYVYDSKKREVCDAITLQPLDAATGGRCTRSRSATRSGAWRSRWSRSSQLGSPDESLRLAAAEELAKASSPEAAVLLHRALDKEKVAKVHDRAGAGGGARRSAERRTPTRGWRRVELIQRTRQRRLPRRAAAHRWPHAGGHLQRARRARARGGVARRRGGDVAAASRSAPPAA